MSSDPIYGQLKQLCRAIVHRPPYRSGAIPIQGNELTIFYGKKGQAAGRIDFTDMSDVDLENLSQACDPATFGRNQEDVFDESYRKAGKLDTSDFAVKLDLQKNGLMEIIHNQLLSGVKDGQTVHAELYKLNVYGPGSFFKPHKDTPRGENMFGSLVIIFPTRHEGGSLVFRHGEKEWMFDSAQAVAAYTEPSVAYATFFSDVDHEVTLVRSGYRVTVTYNLYFVDSNTPPSPPPSDTNPFPLQLKSVFEQLLADSTFLPDGGNLGFGLDHMYPMLNMPEQNEPLDNLKPCLKGSDADILRVCDTLSLKVGLWMFYQGDYTVLVPKAPPLHGESVGGSSLTYLLMTEYGGIRINPFYRRKTRRGRPNDSTEDDSDVDCPTEQDYSRPEDDYDPIEFTVRWVTRPSASNCVKDPYVAHGNEPSLHYAYGYITLIVEVGKPGERATKID